MPNTVVKLTNAESTWLEAAREDRKLLIKKKALTVMVSAFLLCATLVEDGLLCGIRREAVIPKVDAASPRGLMAPPGLTALGAKGSACERLRLTGGLRASALGRYEAPLRWGGTAPFN